LALKIPGFTERLVQLFEEEQRRRGKLSQKAFAKELGFDQQAFNDWINGVQPDFENVQKIAQAFRVSWKWLLVGDPVPREYEVAPTAQSAAPRGIRQMRNPRKRTNTY
jgi:transcriptional regulator with XRE-family HTH domain